MASYEMLNIYCDGAAEERLKENVRNPLRMGIRQKDKYLRVNSSRGA
jgi:hypothetical protein